MAEAVDIPGLGAEGRKEEYKLLKEQELRFEVEGKEPVLLRLRSGLAEVFGTELMKGRTYTFGPGSKIAVFTWHGCVIELEGTIDAAYVAKETPMTFYLNIHGLLEQMRDTAETVGNRGPVVLIAGPTDVGKSTLARILLNYAVRRQRTPLLVDFDVGQGFFSVPGTVGMSVIERVAEAETGFSQSAPLIYPFGGLSPSSNIVLYNMLIERVAKSMTAKFEADRKVDSSGTIISTCGWVTGSGYKSLLTIAKEFEANVVLVLDQERVYNWLLRDLPKFVQVVFVPKSGGVVVRSKEYRAESRNSRIRNYFYGSAEGNKNEESQFYPHSFDVPFNQLKIFKIGSPPVPSSCLPIGMQVNDSQTKITPITSVNQLTKHQLLALSTCPVSDKNNALQYNVQGFICVTNIDPERGMLTVLSPQPRPLPTEFVYLSTEVQYLDAS